MAGKTERKTVEQTQGYSETQPAREDVDALRGPAVLSFGTDWCGYCLAAKPKIEQALAAHPAIPNFKVEDGKGRPLGRSFGVKLWPTLIFLRDGAEVARLVRPTRTEEIAAALDLIDVE